MLFFTEGDEQLKLTDILVFGTGADQVPPLGFSPDPTLMFANISPITYLQRI